MAIYNLGAQNNQTLGSFISLEDASIYLYADAQKNASNVDAVFFYTDLQKATFGAPADPAVKDKAPNGIFQVGLVGFESMNATHFRMLAADHYHAANFDSVFDSNEALESAFTSSPENALHTRINQLKVGDVVGYRTATGKYGAFIIRELTAGKDGKCGIEIIVQQYA